MDRRRALLAASAASGGGDTPFYAEFFFDYCEEAFWGHYCERAADALSLECYEKGKALVEKYGYKDGIYIVLKNPIDYGFEVYIEGELTTQMELDQGLLQFVSETGEYIGTMERSGMLSDEG